MKRFTILMVLLALAGSASAQLRRGGMFNRRQAARPAAAAAATGAEENARPAVATREELRNARGTNGTTRLVFNQTPLELVLESYAQEVGRTIIPAPDLPKATITLRSAENQTLTKDEYLFAIEHILTMNGVVLEPRGEKFLRALARKTVRTQGIPMLLENRGLLEEKGQVVSQLITFHNIAVAEAQKALEGFKDPNGLFQVFERTNAILVTDTQENINRMLEIAKAIDIATPVLEDVFVRQIKFAVANDIKTSLETIVTESQKESQTKEVAPKSSGAPGFGTRASQPMGSRLLNLHNRPGVNQPPPAPTPNETMLAAVSDADRGMIRGKVLILSDERSNKLIIVTSKANMDFFDKVIEQLDVETTPPTVVKVYRLKYADAEDVSDMINDLIGNAPSSKASAKSSQNAAAKTSTGGGANMTTGRTSATRQPANKRTGEPQAGELSKENTTVLADKRINGLVVMTQKELVPTVEAIIESMDIKLSQVLIETVIIEVTLGDGLNTGIDWVRYNKDGKNGMSRKSGDGYALGGGGGGNAEALFGFAVSNAVNYIVNPTGSGINYFLKSDRLNLAAIINASKNDDRSKYIASPIVMTVDNKEATIEATESRKFYSGSTSSSSGSLYGSVSYNYSDKDLGIKIKVTPKINPNGTVMLEVEEEYSQLGAGQSVLVSSSASNGAPSKETVDTALQRKMSADILLENGQTVVLGGLTETKTSERQTGIPILKDIPWIGKWLFGKVEQSEDRKELLVFMTPYVLDDAESAQVEALRRKKTLSDPNPWDDHGWSLSELADPVEKKEQLRRLKDEWKKQDEERKTKIAIEKAKVERVKALEKMSQDERELWLKMHKEELDEEKREELEEKMLDEKSQEDLKKLAAEVRERKLKEAAAELGAADEAYRGENARAVKNRDDAEKAEK